MVPFSGHPVKDKMESLFLEGIGGCVKHGVYLSYHSCFYYVSVTLGFMCYLVGYFGGIGNAQIFFHVS